MTILTGREVWRKYNVDGVPSSGAHQPDKSDIIPWATSLETLVQSGAAGLAYATLSALNADLLHAANSLAIVYGDATPANNGMYVKVGASGSGSWTRIGDLPGDVIPLTVTGGTGNAIIAIATETPSVPGAKLYLMTPTANNTAATTITVNGGAAVAIKNAFGSTLASGSLVNGSQVLMAWQTDHYQLLISAVVDGSAILADTITARDAASGYATAAASSASALGNQVHQYDTRALAIAATIPVGVQAVKITRRAVGSPISYLTYIPGTVSGPDAFLEAGGHYWELDTTGTWFPGEPVRPQIFNASGSSLNTTGTISSASTSLTLAAALDFQNGQGIRVNHAGAATGLGAPSALTVTPNGTTGATAYAYTVAPFTASGGYGPALTNTTIANGNATLTATNFNALSWAAAASAVGYAVYGRTAGSMVLLAFVAGTTFNDVGAALFTSQTAPDWMPSTPPGSGAANWLISSISSGAGTTSLVLGNAAGTTATTQGVYHDDTVKLQAALTAAISSKQSLDLNGGIYRITSAVTGTGPLQIYGNGPTVGASAGSIVLTSPTQHGLDLSGQYIVLRDFNFEGGGGASSGQISGSAVNFNSSAAVWIERVTSQYAFNAIGSTTGSGPFWITTNLLHGYGSLINITNIGDSFISNNTLSPVSKPGYNAIGINLTNPAGAKIVSNKINAGGYGYAVGIQATITASDGDLLITGNSIEQTSTAGILVDRSGAFTFGNFVFNGNQMVTAGRGIYFPSASAWASSIAVNGNIIYALFDGVHFLNVTDLSISGNVFGGAGNGISIGASTVRCMIGTNVFSPSLTTQIADASAAAVYAAITGTKPTYP